MVKKGLSFDEKREKMQEIFFETQDFFQLKELEKMAPKRKGIVSQSVKEVLQSLVDDSLVCCEKIGTSNYFWAFPSTAQKTRKRKLDNLESEYAKQQEHSVKLAKLVGEAEAARESEGGQGSDDRATKLRELAELKEEAQRLTTELKAYKDNDPTVVEEKRVAAKAAVEAANRWTDNVFSVLSWVTKIKPGVDESSLQKHWGIPADFDYLQATSK